MAQALVCLLPGPLAFPGCYALRWIGVCFGKPLGEFLFERGQLFFCSKISPLVGIFPQVVKLLRPFVIADVAITLRSNCVVVFTMSRKGWPLPGSVRILEKRDKACSFEGFPPGKPAEIEKGWIDAEKFRRAIAPRSLLHGGGGDDKGNSGRALPELSLIHI